MKLTWYGHSCFKLSTAQGDVVFDPYEPNYVPGLELPELQAELCLCSHGHGDHNYTAGVKLSGADCGLKVTKIPCFHDEKHGRLRGKNTIHIVEAEGKRVAHMGDLGHVLSPEQVAELGHIDLMLIPIGGYYTIDAATAKRVVQQVRPELVVPMHYRGEGFGFDAIGTVESFTALMDNVSYVNSNQLEPDSVTTPAVVVLKCPVK
jgi:L-ascorbate metabolism protein UlaG (beta-lactamase superfamily)